MALSLGTPSAPFDYLVTGTGSWADMVTLIANSADLEQIGNNTYIVKSKIRIEATMDRLLESLVISRDDGGWSVRNGGKVYFGETITYLGADLYRKGCLIVEEDSAWARGSNNVNNDNARMKDASTRVEIINSYWQVLDTTRSDFDFADGVFYARGSFYHNVSSTFDHFYCELDIDGYQSTHLSNSNFEFNSSTSYTNFDDVVLNNNSLTVRQAVFFTAPPSPIVNFGGANFSRVSSATGVMLFDNPIATSLASVHSSTGKTAQERRTLDISTLVDGAGSQARFVAEDADTAVEVNSLTDAGGILNTQLIRRNWPTGTFTPEEKTPHILRFHKYGYFSQELNFDATPTASGQGGFQLPSALISDPNISQAKAAALSHTGITITFEATPVSWNGKDFSVTVTGDLTVNPSLSSDDIYHYIQASNEDGTLFGSRAPNQLMLNSTETQRGEYSDGFKGVRVIDQTGTEFLNVISMQADDGTYLSFIPPVNITVSNTSIVDTSKYRLVNETDNTVGPNNDGELAIGVASGGTGFSIVLLEGTDYTQGDTLRLYATQQNGTDAKQNYTEAAVATTANISFVGVQQDWTQYTDIGVDGFSVDQSQGGECTTDFINVQVDVNDSDNKTAKSRVMAWLVYAQTTDEGIRNWFGALNLVDASNGFWDQTVSDINVSNEKVGTTLEVKDPASLRKEDGSSMISGSTYNIEWEVSGLVNQLETGTSGLTPTESAQLAVIDTVDTNVDQALVDLSDIQGAGFDTNTDSLKEISDAVSAIDAGDATEAKQDQILGDIAALDAVVDTKASQSSVDAVEGKVDTLATDSTAIKVKTDQLTFTVANQVDSNTESMNGAEVLGTGTSADKWRGE